MLYVMKRPAHFCCSHYDITLFNMWHAVLEDFWFVVVSCIQSCT
jgi:hypothetical protein